MKHPPREREQLSGTFVPPGPVSGTIERPQRPFVSRISALYGNESAWSERIVAWSQSHPELSDPPEAVEE
jgi:hypothetical protein